MECITFIGTSLKDEHAEMFLKDAGDILNVFLNIITTEKLSHSSDDMFVTYVFQVWFGPQPLFRRFFISPWF